MLLLLLVSFALLLFLPLVPLCLSVSSAIVPLSSAFPSCALSAPSVAPSFLSLSPLPSPVARSPIFFLMLLIRLPSLLPSIPLSSVASSFPPSGLSSALLSSVLDRRLQPSRSLFLCLFYYSLFPFDVVSSAFSGSSYFFFFSLSQGSSAPTSSSIVPPVTSVPSPTLAPSVSFAPSLMTTVLQLNFCLIPAFLRCWGGLPHVLMMLMFQAPRVPPFRLPFQGGYQSCHKGKQGVSYLGEV